MYSYVLFISLSQSSPTGFPTSKPSDSPSFKVSNNTLYKNIRIISQMMHALILFKQFNDMCLLHSPPYREYQVRRLVHFHIISYKKKMHLHLYYSSFVIISHSIHGIFIPSRANVPLHLTGQHYSHPPVQAYLGNRLQFQVSLQHSVQIQAVNHLKLLPCHTGQHYSQAQTPASLVNHLQFQVSLQHSVQVQVVSHLRIHLYQLPLAPFRVKLHHYQEYHHQFRVNLRLSAQVQAVSHL